MAIIEGQIEPLKQIKEVLNENGITRFNSIGEINDFLKNYKNEKKKVSEQVRQDLEKEEVQLKCDLAQFQSEYDKVKETVTKDLKDKIYNLEEELDTVIAKIKDRLFLKIFLFPKLLILKNKKKSLEKNFEDFIRAKTQQEARKLVKVKTKLDPYENDREALFEKRVSPLKQKIDHAKEVVDGLYPLIAGAVGENQVIKEVEKLSDDFHLFNDFYVEFRKPIYNKNENDHIFSIQIDHLMVSSAGVFILETKNWSKKSLENLDLRSPVQQVKRSSYALFVLLNSQLQHNGLNLEHHHWGSKQVPIRNVIVMINEKPVEKFKFVKVLKLKELNKYVEYFDPIFSEDEVDSICNYLRDIKTG
jgi:hypothetical protein